MGTDGGSAKLPPGGSRDLYTRGFALGVPQQAQGRLQVLLLAPPAPPRLLQTLDCPRRPL